MNYPFVLSNNTADNDNDWKSRLAEWAGQFGLDSSIGTVER